MSLLSRWVEKQVKKKGLKSFILKILEMATGLTKSKKDDEVVAEIKKILDKLD